MTVKQLISKLQSFDSDLEVMMCQNDDSFTHQPLETIAVKPVTFKGDDIPKKEWPNVDCLVLTDEI